MRLRLVLALATLAAVAFAPLASAHASANSSDGKIKITWGWLTEPAYVGEKLKVDLIIRDAASNAGIGGVTMANITELALHYGDDEYELGNITANTGVKGATFAGPGNYTTSNAVIPTQAGIYELHIKATIAGSTVDLEIPAQHELETNADLMFPAPKDATPLEDRVAALEAKVTALQAKASQQATSTTPVTTQITPTKSAPAIELVGALAVVGIAAFILGRRVH